MWAQKVAFGIRWVYSFANILDVKKIILVYPLQLGLLICHSSVENHFEFLRLCLTLCQENLSRFLLWVHSQLSVEKIEKSASNLMLLSLICSTMSRQSGVELSGGIANRTFATFEWALFACAWYISVKMISLYYRANFAHKNKCKYGFLQFEQSWFIWLEGLACQKLIARFPLS